MRSHQHQEQHVTAQGEKKNHKKKKRLKQGLKKERSLLGKKSDSSHSYWSRAARFTQTLSEVNYLLSKTSMHLMSESKALFEKKKIAMPKNKQQKNPNVIVDPSPSGVC